MKQFDDQMPEEAAENRLTELLQKAYGVKTEINEEQQAQSIAHVRERLQERLSLLEEPDRAPTGTAERFLEYRREAERKTGLRGQSRIITFVSKLAAVLVVGVLIATSVLLFASHGKQKMSIPGPDSSVGGKGAWQKTITAHVARNGLEASMSVIGGPDDKYFLSEVVALDLSLTNHTNKTFQLRGSGVGNLCNPALWVNMMGGGAPHYTPPPMGVLSCPLISIELKPGETLKGHTYMMLTDSGLVTLTEGARFMVTKKDANGGWVTTDEPTPLDGYWPSLKMSIDSKVPEDRKLSFSQRGNSVIVNAPEEVREHLLYMYYLECPDINGGAVSRGNFMWEPIKGNIVQIPTSDYCTGTARKWGFAFSAVGYSIVTGEWQHYLK